MEFLKLIMLLWSWSILFLLPLVLSQRKCNPRGEFSCTGGSCIPSDQVCDGSVNCPDGSDETSSVCSILDCSSFFKCDYGACVSRTAVCNGVKDCADGSDEKCSKPPDGAKPDVSIRDKCGSSQEACSSGQCVDASAFCDGMRDCVDGSDETTERCSLLNCPDWTFRCSYGACIPKKKVCDGAQNCVDGSDEKGPGCGREPIAPTQPPSDKISAPDSCAVPVILNGMICDQFNKSKCLSPGQTGTVNTVYEVVCDANHHFLEYDTLNFFICLDSGWGGPTFPSCVRGCKPLKSDAHLLECKYKNKNIACDGVLPVGTSVVARCKEFYFLEPGALFNKECSSFGDIQLDKCYPECGNRNFAEGQPKYPWAASIHRYKDAKYSIASAGVIVSPRFILTAVAGVFASEVEDLRVIVGRSNVFQEGGKWEQIAEVSEIIYYDNYRPDKNNLLTLNDRDLALLKLKKTLTLTDGVQPVCLTQERRSSSVGLAVGFGLTNPNNQSGTYGELKGVEFCILDAKDCLRSPQANRADRVKVVYDKLCASTENSCGGKNIEKGLKNSKLALDTGFPLVVKDSVTRKKYLLRGISSTFLHSSPSLFSTFTNVRYKDPVQEKYVIWIKKYID